MNAEVDIKISCYNLSYSSMNTKIYRNASIHVETLMKSIIRRLKAIATYESQQFLTIYLNNAATNIQINAVVAYSGSGTERATPTLQHPTRPNIAPQ